MKKFYLLHLLILNILCNEISSNERFSVSKKKSLCKISKDCNRQSYLCIEGICRHKSFFDPLTVNENSLAVITMIITGLCMSVGLGGLN